jgi:hypothetical protein
LESLAVRWLFPGSEVLIESRCLDCGERVRVRLKDEEILEIDPPNAVGYMMTPFTKWREGSTSFN